MLVALARAESHPVAQREPRRQRTVETHPREVRVSQDPRAHGEGQRTARVADRHDVAEPHERRRQITLEQQRIARHAGDFEHDGHAARVAAREIDLVMERRAARTARDQPDERDGG